MMKNMNPQDKLKNKNYPRDIEGKFMNIKINFKTSQRKILPSKEQ